MNEALRDQNLAYLEQRKVLYMHTSLPINYAIEHVSESVFDVANASLRCAVDNRPCLVIADDRLWSEFGRQIEQYSHTNLNCLRIVRLMGDESSKSLEEVASLCEIAIDLGMPRNGVFIAVGGGTILDTVGFAAAIYRRGIAHIRIPTTLIGMIDVGVGIKSAVNFRHKKNALGAFYPPLRTLNDVTFLAKLPHRELACGIAEAIKIGLVCDNTLFETIDEHCSELITTGFRSPAAAAISVLIRAEAAMMDQLQPNLFETDLRRLVDFGHSFSPTIESTTNYAIAHGEAVALDMLISTAIAVERTMCDYTILLRLSRMYKRAGLPITHPVISPLLLERALVDARLHRGGTLNLVVPTGIGSADFVQDVAYQDLVSALRAIASLD